MRRAHGVIVPANPQETAQGREMVFFNYSTMQMAAKVVYYGPGLCGKTTNLHHIYGQTSSECRGEMVSLETETDRTLFFDLLPIDVGQIAGFNTRIQLYTVPGQVFYNTTRKLVLKGVDGIVFVADSQRPMLQANLDSLNNLEQNLAEMGIAFDEASLVFQYNKRDLDDICSLEELNAALNHLDAPYFEASALHGEGVFETLKGISRITLLSLKRRLMSGESSSPGMPAETSPADRPDPAVPELFADDPTPAADGDEITFLDAEEMSFADGEESSPHQVLPPGDLAAEGSRSAGDAGGAPPAVAAPQPAAVLPADPPEARVQRTSSRNVLEELERLRRQAMGLDEPPAAPPPHANGRGELRRDIQLTLPRAALRGARRVFLTLEVENGDEEVTQAASKLQVDLDDAGSVEELILRLDIAVAPEG